MEVLLLGPLVVTHAGHHVRFGSRKERAVLAALALHHGGVVPAERVVIDVWGDDGPLTARQTLRGLVSRLRATLGPGAVLSVSGGTGYRLSVAPHEVDAQRLENAVVAARGATARGDHARTEALLGAALEEWRGRPLTDLSDDPLVEAQRTRLLELRLEAVERRVEVALALGRHREVLSELETHVAEEPFRERRWAQLMVALHRCGRRTEALQAYQRVRRTLLDEVGLEPGPELRELEVALLSGGRGSAPAEEAVNLHLPDTPYRHLDSNAWRRDPAPPAPRLIGRGVDIDETGRAVRRERLVTLVGPGGVGKTRLALEAARAAQDAFPDGVHLVDLSATATPGPVAAVVAGVLDLPLPGVHPPSVELSQPLRGKRMLVVLDNCEHVASAAAEVAAALLGAAGVHVLATGRRDLALPGESVRVVSPLTLRDAGRLFRDRAWGAGRPAPGEDAAVAELCRRLDRLPLALELAAGATCLRTVPELLELLEDEELPAGRCDGPGGVRHQSLRTVARSSFDLLDVPARVLFTRLSLFRADVDLCAVRAVCSGPPVPDVDEALTTLVRASLVVAEPREGRMRYRLLETLRCYAAEWADPAETETLRLRHATWAVRLVGRAEEGVCSPAERACTSAWSGTSPSCDSPTTGRCSATT